MAARRRPSVYHQDSSIYVIGTEDVEEACRIANITPETHKWSSTSYGHAIRRKNGWQFRDSNFLPKDARPAVAFIGPIHRRGRSDSEDRWIGGMRAEPVRLAAADPTPAEVEAAARALNPLAWHAHDHYDKYLADPVHQKIIKKSLTQARRALRTAHHARKPGDAKMEET